MGGGGGGDRGRLGLERGQEGQARVRWGLRQQVEARKGGEEQRRV